MTEAELRTSLLIALRKVWRQHDRGQINDEQASREAGAAILACLSNVEAGRTFQAIERRYA